MKIHSRLLLAVTSLLSLLAGPLQAQDPVTTGIVQRIDPAAGTMTVLSEQTKRPVDFVGVNQAILVHTGGDAAMLRDLREGMPVTVQYAVRNQQWYVSKLIFGAEEPTTAATAANGATPVINAPGAVVPTGPIPGQIQFKEPANPAANSRGLTDPVRPDGGSVVRSRSGGNSP